MVTIELESVGPLVCADWLSYSGALRVPHADWTRTLGPKRGNIAASNCLLKCRAGGLRYKIPSPTCMPSVVWSVCNKCSPCQAYHNSIYNSLDYTNPSQCTMTDKVVEAAKMSSQQLRKIKKPMIERRRRERINDSLNQLKALVLDAMNKEESRYSKMEKADILEMTVKHLKSAQRQSLLMSPDGNGQNMLGKYRTGFAECAHEVGRYLGSVDGLTPEVRMRLMGHLSGCMQSAETRIPGGACATSTLSGSPEARSSLPAATQLSSLPGANVQILSVNTSDASQTARVPSVSPMLPASPVSSPELTITSPMIVVSPNSNQQPNGLLKDAIPLYFASSSVSVGSSRPASSAPPSPQYSCSSTDSFGHSPVHRQSPELAQDAPQFYRAHFTAISSSQSPPYVREYKPTIIRAEEHNKAKRAFETDSFPAMQCKAFNLPVWRPW